MKWVYFGLIVSTSILTALLFIRVEPEIRFGTTRYSYSWYYTDALETIQIHTLINDSTSFYVDEDFIERVSFSNDTETLSMDLVQIGISNQTVLIEEENYSIITWTMRPKGIPGNTKVTIDGASLHIHYQNGEHVMLEIGSIHYVFQQDVRADLGVTGLTATHEDIADIETVSAIQIGLKNRTSGLLEIRSIEVESTIVSTNTKAMIRDVDCTDIKTVANCLGVEEYSFFIQPIPPDMHEVILPGQDTIFYVPLSYQKTLPFHRFVIRVTYQVGGEEYAMYIDDFPFIRTTPFQRYQEEEYIWYVVDSNS